MASRLTTTSYAFLGLLAIKPWTTYQLAQQMDRGLGAMWPRTRSKLYEEPKKLVAYGLAQATAESVGRRPRTVYSITPAGREALAEWLSRPGEPPALEFEQLLKIFFSEHGTKADLVETLAAIRSWADQRQIQNRGIAESYLAGNGPFPQRVPQLILIGAFMVRFADMVARWAEWAEGVVRDWPEEMGDVQLAPAVFEDLAGSWSWSEGRERT